ncbi:hypothetical protein [Bacillus solitudinis]|nr:hypothetical protein [Bacillus solitudinis]
MAQERFLQKKTGKIKGRMEKSSLFKAMELPYLLMIIHLRK